MPRLLDPSCGSGTFLVAALRAGLQQLDLDDHGSDATLLGELIHQIVGFDVNPVSALMSRVNLLLALGDRSHFLNEVTFQVFQADSIVLPRVPMGQMDFEHPTEHVLISTAVSDFRLHPVLMSQNRMGILRLNLESSLRSNLSVELFLVSLEAELRAAGSSDDELTQMKPSLLALYDQLAELRDTDKDDVWPRVIEQFMAPFLLGEFDLVVGNPPWVSWKNLPEAWKTRSAPIWRAWGLWKTRRGGRGIPLSDISTLLFARALETYAPNGLVAMLLPKSVQLADPSGNAFRRSHLRPESEDRIDPNTDTHLQFRVLMVDDFVSVNPFSPDASNQTIVLYARPNQPHNFPAPIRTWSRRNRSRIKAEWSWHRVETDLQFEDDFITPVDPENVESPWGLVPGSRQLPLSSVSSSNVYHFGRGFETRGLDGLFTFAIQTPRPTGHRLEIRVRNLPDEGRNTNGETPREGVVEADLLWPLVKGEDVSRWAVSTSERYLFVPYDVRCSPTNRITTDECARLYTRLFRYLQPWISRFASRSMYQREISSDFPWELSGPIEHLRDSGAIVFVRYLASGGRPAAAVRVPAYDEKLGRTTLPIPNNKSNIFYASSSEEAHYLAAMINSLPAQDALSRFAVSTGVTPGALARLPIPSFLRGDPRHMRLAELGASAAAKVADQSAMRFELITIEAEIDEVVWSIAGL